MRKPPYPPSPPTPTQRKKLEKIMGAARGKKVDPMDYMKPKRIGKAAIPKPAKRQPPKPKGSAGIGENLPKPYKRPKKKPTSGSTSARIRNMEKMYSNRKNYREL